MYSAAKSCNVLEIHSLDRRLETRRSATPSGWDGDSYVAMLVERLGVPVERHVIQTRAYDAYSRPDGSLPLSTNRIRRGGDR